MLDAHKREIHLVVACDTYGGYAKDGTIPWDVPEDMKRFQKLTKGGVCIMGRNTYEDMVKMREAKGHTITDEEGVLPGRESFVITTNEEYKPVGAKRGTGITTILDTFETGDARNIFIIGGHRLFVEALGRPCAVHMAIIKGDPYFCDTQFPLEVLNTHYNIVSGEETDLCYNVVYHPKPVVHEMSEQQKWEQFIRENFRPA